MFGHLAAALLAVLLALVGVLPGCLAKLDPGETYTWESGGYTWSNPGGDTHRPYTPEDAAEELAHSANDPGDPKDPRKSFGRVVVPRAVGARVRRTPSCRSGCK